MNFPFVSIIIPTYNSGKYIKQCLESIFRLKYPKDRYEILIVDGGSTDSTINTIKSFGLKVFPNRLKNAASGRNIGIRNSNGEYIAFTDSDCIVDADWIINAMKLFQTKNTEFLSCVGGPNYSPESDRDFAKLIAYSQETFLGSGGSFQSSLSNKLVYVSSLPNCNAIYKKKILVKIGGFDPFFTVGQDAEMNFRILKKGFKFLYSPDIIVWHHRRSTFTKFSKRMYDYGHAMALISKKHKKVVRWYSLVSSAFVIMLITSPLLLFLIPELGSMYLLLGILYIGSLLVNSISILTKYKRKILLLTPFMLFIQHFSYGLGFSIGLLKMK